MQSTLKAQVVDTIPGLRWLRRLRLAWDLRPALPVRVLPQRRLVEQVLAQQVALVERVTRCPVETLAIRRLLLTETGVVVALVAPREGAGRALAIKVASGPLAAASLSRHYESVHRLRGESALGDLRNVIPVPIAQGDLDERGYVVESALAGTSGRRFLTHTWTLAWLQRRAVDWIGTFGEATLVRQTIGAAELDRLAGQALSRLDRATVVGLEDPRVRQCLDELRLLLEQELVGRTVPLTWVHGDFWPGNLLVTWTGAITGIVDWDRAGAKELPVHDLFHLLTYPVAMLRRYRHAEVILEKLIVGQLDRAERRLIDVLGERLGLPFDAGFRRAAALVYWLRLMDTNFARFPHCQRDQRWLDRNFWPVLSHHAAWRS